MVAHQRDTAKAIRDAGLPYEAQIVTIGIEMTGQTGSQVFSYASAILGLAGTFYYGTKSTRLQKLLRTISWSDVEHGVDVLARKLARMEKHDVLLSLSVPGSIVSSLMIIRGQMEILRFQANTLTKGECQSSSPDIIVQTRKSRVGIPSELARLKNRRLLVVDSAVVTGDVLAGTINALVELGFPRRDITCVSLIASQLAIASGKGPDAHWLTINDTNYRLPWGNLWQ